MAICWQCNEEVPENNNYCGACRAPQGEIKEKRQDGTTTVVVVQTLSDGLVTAAYCDGKCTSFVKHNGQQTYEDAARHQAAKSAAAGPAAE